MKNSGRYQVAAATVMSAEKRSYRHIARAGAKIVAALEKRILGAHGADLPHLLWVTDAAGQCIHINDAFADFLGASPSALLADSWVTFLHPEDVSETVSGWLDSVQRGASHQARYRLRRHDGVYRWMLANACAVSDESGEVTHWVGTNTDINDLVEELLSLRASLVSEHDLTATWAHDIRTPLAVISMKAGMTALQTDEPQHVATNMQAIIKAAGRADTMISNLLNSRTSQAAKLSVHATRSTDLREVLSACRAELSMLYPQRLGFEIDAQPIIGKWDKVAMQRAVENLVNNAIKYGDPNTTIKVALHRRGKMAVLSVQNHGPVLSHESQQLIFKLYVRMSKQPEQQGWGIGLSVVYRVAEQHGGFAEVNSSPGEGTTFRMLLPISDTHEDR